MFFTLIWAIAWALNDFPHIIENPGWFIALVICLFFDL